MISSDKSSHGNTETETGDERSWLKIIVFQGRRIKIWDACYYLETGASLWNALILEYPLIHMLKMYNFRCKLRVTVFLLLQRILMRKGFGRGREAINKLSKIRDYKHCSSFRYLHIWGFARRQRSKWRSCWKQAAPEAQRLMVFVGLPTQYAPVMLVIKLR